VCWGSKELTFVGIGLQGIPQQYQAAHETIDDELLMKLMLYVEEMLMLWFLLFWILSNIS
jgi:hypothetical protein